MGRKPEIKSLLSFQERRWLHKYVRAKQGNLTKAANTIGVSTVCIRKAINKRPLTLPVIEKIKHNIPALQEEKLMP